MKKPSADRSAYLPVMRQKILPVDVDIILYLDALSKGTIK